MRVLRLQIAIGTIALCAVTGCAKPFNSDWWKLGRTQEPGYSNLASAPAAATGPNGAPALPSQQAMTGQVPPGGSLAARPANAPAGFPGAAPNPFNRTASTLPGASATPGAATAPGSYAPMTTTNPASRPYPGAYPNASPANYAATPVGGQQRMPTASLPSYANVSTTPPQIPGAQNPYGAAPGYTPGGAAYASQPYPAAGNSYQNPTSPYAATGTSAPTNYANAGTPAATPYNAGTPSAASQINTGSTPASYASYPSSASETANPIAPKYDAPRTADARYSMSPSTGGYGETTAPSTLSPNYSASGYSTTPATTGSTTGNTGNYQPGGTTSYGALNNPGTSGQSVGPRYSMPGTDNGAGSNFAGSSFPTSSFPSSNTPVPSTPAATTAPRYTTPTNSSPYGSYPNTGTNSFPQ